MTQAELSRVKVPTGTWLITCVGGRPIPGRVPGQDEDELRPTVRVIQLPAEQLAQPPQPVAHRLPVDVQLVGDGAEITHVAEPGPQGVQQHLSRRSSNSVQRREALLAEHAEQPGIAVHDHRVQVLVDEHRVLGQNPRPLQRAR